MIKSQIMFSSSCKCMYTAIYKNLFFSLFFSSINSPHFFSLEIIAFKIGEHKSFAQLCKGKGLLTWAPHLCLLSPKLSRTLKNTFFSVTNSLTMCCFSAVLWAGSRPLGHSWITSIAPFISYPILRALLSRYLGFVAPRPSVPFLPWIQMAMFHFPLFPSPTVSI